MRQSWLLGLIWSRKLIVCTAAAASLAGGVTVLLVVPPQYEGHARVTLDFVKRDAITGGRFGNERQAEVFIRSQMQMIMDYQVAVPAAQALGWFDNPDIQAAYAARPVSDRREFAQWLGQRIIASTSVNLVPESNLLQIGYRGATREAALEGANAVRDAYVEANINARRGSASEQADGLAVHVEVLKEQLLDRQKILNDYAKATGLVLTPSSESDPEAIRLQKMSQRGLDTAASSTPRITDAQRELTATDAAIESESQRLGPNNPRLLALKRQRDLLAQQVAAQQSQGQAIRAALEMKARAQETRLEQQKALVLGRRAQILQMKIYQDEVNRVSSRLNAQLTRLAALRQMANARYGGVTPVGEAMANSAPDFPNPSLMLGGSGGLGVMLGVLLALLAELLHRRVRTPRDVELVMEQPILVVLPKAKTRKFQRGLWRIGRRRFSGPPPESLVA